MHINNCEREMSVWNYKGLKVYYYPELDGDGTNQAESFVKFIKEYFPQNKKFNKVFEWCAGPSFIGFALLKEQICDKLCLADINPITIKCVERTVYENNLQEVVSYYVSDNFKSIPKSEVFDLVVSNPPNYYQLNPEHHDYSLLKDDLRPNDPGWKIHEAFYKDVSKYLTKGAYLLIEEVELFADKVYTPITNPIPFDIRPAAPIEDFKRMIKEGELAYIDSFHFHTDKAEGIRMWVMVSKKE